MNDQQLHRKQVVMLALAVVLAISSYWIPLPQQGGPRTLQPLLSGPTGRFAPVELMTFAREPAITARFPMMGWVPQTTFQADPATRGKADTVGPPSAEPLSIKRNSQDLVKNDGIRPGKPPLAPVEDSGPPGGR